MRIKKWGAFFLMFSLLLAGAALLQTEVYAQSEGVGVNSAATSTDAIITDEKASSLLSNDSSAYALTGAKSFVEISRIPHWSRNGSAWQTEVFFVKDSRWVSEANAGNYFWYPNFANTYTTASKINAFMEEHAAAYCVESGAVNPCDSGSAAAVTLGSASNSLSAAEKMKLTNIVANGYPANKAYWASKGLNYFQQASATQMAIWYWTDMWGISGNIGAVSPYTITCTNAGMKEMYDYLISCGSSASTTSIQADAAITSGSVVKSGSSFVYTWNIKLSGCYWNTRLSFSEVPSQASVTVDGSKVTLSNGMYTTSKNGTTITVKMAIPANGNTNRSVTLCAAPLMPEVTTSTVSYFRYDGSIQDMISWDDRYELAPNPAMKTLKSPVYGGRITFYKCDERNSPLSGAIFGIYTDAAGTNPATVYEDDALSRVKKDGYLVTAGYRVTSGWLKSGTYYIKELEAPAGYRVNASIPSVTVIAGQTVSVTVTDEKLCGGKLRILKYDDSGNPVTGAVFGIYTDAGCTKAASVYADRELTTLVSDGYCIHMEAAVAESGWLHPGTYYVKELEAPSGYQMSFEVRESMVKEEGTVDVRFMNKKMPSGSLKIIKSDSVYGDGLVSATFGIFSDSACTVPADVYADQELKEFIEDGYLLTTAIGSREEGYQGIATSGFLKPGHYYVKELYAPEGYVLSETVTAVFVYSTDVMVKVELTNHPICGRVELKKADADTGSLLAGAEFTVYEWDGTDYVKAGVLEWNEVDCDYISGDLLWTKENQGKFKVVETKAPENYANDGWEEEFILTGYEQWFNFEVVNEAQKGTVTVMKSGGSGKPLSGVFFSLYTTQELPEAVTYEYEGVVYYRLVSAVTDEDGKAAFGSLPAVPDCQYLLIEEQAADGKALLAEPVYIGVLPKDGKFDLTVAVQDGANFSLPLTGAAGFGSITIWVFAASALMGMLLLSKRKGETRS